MAPDKAYVKPDEPVTVQFLQSDKPDAPKTAQLVGLKAAEFPGLFTKAPAAEFVTDAGKPLFQLYTFEGKPIEPKAGVKIDPAAPAIDISALFPQIKEGGTFILTWKDSTPLLINTLFNPGGEKDPGSIVVTHIEPLQYAVISTDKGDIKATFAYDVAPHTIDNFITLADQKLYDGSNFHRIIKGFMIQGGDVVANVEGRAGTGSPGYDVMHEFSNKLHVRGVLSMARSSALDSAGSQFFIMLDKNPGLDGKYSAFGQVLEGMDVVDKIAETKVSDDNGAVAGPKPAIKSIRILPATAEMYGIKK
jgi:cyclophilin family peptidyl-prolyl cis-trans isomerase